MTQAPDKRLQKKMKAHLVSFLSPEKEFSAADFRERAKKLIPEILRRQRIPLIVGGTGLYFRALMDGLFENSQGASLKDESLRGRLAAEETEKGAGHLHGILKNVDPESAEKIHPNDLRRVIRALEVYTLSGQKLSLKKTQRSGIRDEYSHRIFFINRDREDLYDRINRRADMMMTQGLLAEVRGLSRKKLSKTAGMALGLRELTTYLKGQCSLEDALMLLKKNTRNYAKRQIAWFRHEPGARALAVTKNESAQQVAKKIIELVRH